LRVGGWFPGYLDVESTDAELGRLGVTERAVTVSELNDAFAAVEGGRSGDGLAALGARGWSRREGPADERSMRLALALDDLARSASAVAATVNCHSEILRWNPTIGITACLGASLLTSAGVPVSCTGDLPTALALVLARALSGKALYCEFYTPERETGLMMLAAGGEGDPAWADPAHPIVVEPNDHYPGEHGAGTSLSFRLEPGPATALSLSPVGETWRLAWATGEIVEARYDGMGGPNGMFRFDSGSAFEAGARWIASGATHHNALAGGRLDVEIPVLARALGIEEERV
jgi:L-arabinose isomerase